jgi:hypothetical protein
VTDLLHPAGTERPPIDPRIARRWIDARRQEGRKRLHLLIALGVLVVIVAAAAGSLYSPLLHVRHVRVTVDGPLSATSVGRLSGVSRSTLMIHVDGAAIAARLDADPWIGQARVTRRWPGTVTISVVVRHPLAMVALSAAPAGGGVSGAGVSGGVGGGAAVGGVGGTSSAAGWAEVDPTGRVLADVAVPPGGVPVLQGIARVPSPGGWIAGSSGLPAGPNAAPSGLVDMAAASDGPDMPAGPAAALAVLDALPAALRADVVSVNAAGGPGLSLVISPPRLASGIVTVALGDGSQLQSKVTAMVTLLANADLSGVTGLDLSVPNRPATILSAPGTQG